MQDVEFRRFSMKENLYSLTAPQRSIYLTEQYFSNTAINTICGYTFITEAVDFEMLEKAIHEMVKCNDGMRLQLASDKQFVADFKPFPIAMVELASKEDIEKKALEMANTPFIQSSESLFQFIFFKLPNGSGGFIVNVHHLIRRFLVFRFNCQRSNYHLFRALGWNLYPKRLSFLPSLY